MKQGLCMRKLVEKANDIKFNYLYRLDIHEAYEAYYKDFKIIKEIGIDFIKDEELDEQVMYTCIELGLTTRYLEKIIFFIDCEE